MPRGDRTGPWGMGSMTGKGAGFCAGYSTPGFTNAAPAGLFFGRGGKGRRNRFFTTGNAGWMHGRTSFRHFEAAAPEFSSEEEIRRLRQEADYLEKTLSGIRERIARMEKDSTA